MMTEQISEPTTTMTKPARRRAALIEDVEFLLSTGENLDMIIKRVGAKSRLALLATLRRCNRQDLVDQLTRKESCYTNWPPVAPLSPEK